MRTSEIKRTTAETDISLTLSLDGTGKADIDSGVPFLDHMLTLLCVHGRMDMTLRCKGDTDVDDHHSAEDIGICLGEAIRQALGDKRGITRYGNITLPMDEALILCAVDISGRAHLSYGLDIPAEKIGTFDTELGEEFFIALSRSAGISLHLMQLAGKNSHHILEGAFKAFGRAMRQAVRIDPELAGEIPSSKGVLA
ncbi:MAG: imidazoleglycerol-phosphate dehydratase HisB [Ruminococcaceae bacterium]|nr:imidazoleglycerol-phosphate dehydratase HisB [Oscillospiraceae bacterium]